MSASVTIGDYNVTDTQVYFGLRRSNTCHSGHWAEQAAALGLAGAEPKLTILSVRPKTRFGPIKCQNQCVCEGLYAIFVDFAFSRQVKLAPRKGPS